MWANSSNNLLLCMKNESNSCLVVSDSLRPYELWPARLLCPWNFPGNNTGVDCHSFLQGIFLTQGLNLDLLHCKQIPYCMSHQESENCSVVSNSLCPMDYTVYGILLARILEWVAKPFSSGSSQPRDRTRVSCIAGGFFTNWATREAQESPTFMYKCILLVLFLWRTLD